MTTYERSHHHRNIRTVRELMTSLRAGEFAWPGGYVCYFVTSDGAVLSYAAVRENLRLICDAIRTRDSSGWRVVGLGCTCNDDYPGDIVCAHSNEHIDPDGACEPYEV